MPSPTVLIGLAAAAAVGYTLYMKSTRMPVLVIENPVAQPKPTMDNRPARPPLIMNHHLGFPIAGHLPHFGTTNMPVRLPTPHFPTFPGIVAMPPQSNLWFESFRHRAAN